MGLEPTTFCMANASDRSLPFAPVRSTGCSQGLPSKRTQANPSERRTLPSLPRSQAPSPEAAPAVLHPHCAAAGKRYRLQPMREPGSPVLGRRSYFTQSWLSNGPHCGWYW